MICALTVRTLKPGTFEDFREAFMAPIDRDHPPEGWVEFNMVRSTENPDEVVCFGLYDGTVDELRASMEGRDDQQRNIEPYVTAVGADALYEVVDHFATHRTAAG